MDKNRELDARVAKARGLNVEWYYSTTTGHYLPYAVDRSAERTSEHSTRARYLGACWIDAKNDDGEIVEFFGYVLPPFSGGIALAWTLVEEMTKIEYPEVELFFEHAIWTCQVCCDEVGYVRDDGNTAPEAICRAYLKWKEAQDG